MSRSAASSGLPELPGRLRRDADARSRFRVKKIPRPTSSAGAAEHEAATTFRDRVMLPVIDRQKQDGSRATLDPDAKRAMSTRLTRRFPQEGAAVRPARRLIPPAGGGTASSRKLDVLSLYEAGIMRRSRRWDRATESRNPGRTQDVVVFDGDTAAKAPPRRRRALASSVDARRAVAGTPASTRHREEQGRPPAAWSKAAATRRFTGRPGSRSGPVTAPGDLAPLVSGESTTRVYAVRRRHLTTR
jgi:hypothetical protein